MIALMLFRNLRFEEAQRMIRWYSAEAYQGPLSLRFASIFFSSICFGAAAICIAFAGEVEERTAGWLRMMPCSTVQLMSGKLIAIAAGMLGLIAAMLLYGMLAVCFSTGCITGCRRFDRGTDGVAPACRWMRLIAATWRPTVCCCWPARSQRPSGLPGSSARSEKRRSPRCSWAS